MEIDLSDAEFKTLFIKDAQGTQCGPQQHIKIQSEMKDTLIEIKNNLQGNNSSMDEAENQINNLEHKEAKNNHTKQHEKMNPKK